MEGKWQSLDGSAFEYWKLDNTSLEGLSFITSDSAGKPELQERLSIFKRGSKFIFEANPLKQSKTEFEIVASDPSFFRAENEKHDFPKWIMYKVSKTRDSMVARIGDETKSYDFVFVKSPVKE